MQVGRGERLKLLQKERSARSEQIGMLIVENTTGVEPGCIFYNQHPRLA